ncbi:transmembrane protein 272-like [Diadema antillarum]|uniref:transmembrane protein 272-like n=1 Tax=Diadema antillarum TaxID=105358 RepID=UPI003A86CA70
MAEEKVAGEKMTIEDPPAYNEASQETPPSYQSLFGQIKDVRQSSSGPIDFCRKVGSLLLNTLLVTILLALALAIPISMIVIGAIYKDDCPVERFIPIFLIVEGAFQIVKIVLDMKVRIQRQRLPEGDRESFQPSKPELAIGQLLNCFLFAFFIAGNVWVYRIYSPNLSDPTLPDYCQRTLYLYSFWLITSTYIILAASCCCGCLTVAFASCASG